MTTTPFGMTIESRGYLKTDEDEYRFGFQAQESEKELFGGHGSFFKYRISDNRLGRFFSIDPLFRKYPHYSTYSFSGNKLIAFRELEGLEEESAIDDYGAWTKVEDHHWRLQTRAINFSVGASGGLLLVGAAAALHMGYAEDSNGNILEYSNTESYLDVFGAFESPNFKRPLIFSMGGHGLEGESTFGTDIDFGDTEIAILEDLDVIDYLSTNDLTYDLYYFSVSFPHDPSYTHLDNDLAPVFPAFEKVKGFKISASITGHGTAFGWSKTDILAYTAYHESDAIKMTKAFKSLLLDAGEYSTVARDFRLVDEEKQLYRLWYTRTGLEGEIEDSIDSGVDFIKHKDGGYRSTNLKRRENE